jgi:hypothetical protein
MRSIYLIIIFVIIFCFINTVGLNAIENLGLISDLYLNGGSCRDIRIINDLAYVGCDYGLIILDISDSGNPILIGSYRTPYSCISVGIKNDYAILACGLEGLIIVNISNSSNPFYVSNFQFPITYMQAKKIEIQDNYAFVSGASNTPYLYILDIEDIVNPSVIVFDDSDYYRDFVVEDNFIFAVNYELFVIDISEINNPTLISSLDCCNWQPSIELHNDKAFIEDDGALKIVDISDPNNLNLLSTFDNFQTDPKDIVVDDDFAYITGTGDMGLVIIDINNSLNPFLVQEIDYDGFCITKQNNNLFIGWGGVGIFDVEDPYNINLTGVFNTGNACKFSVDDHYAYIANGTSGLTIIDISNPNHPYPVSEFATESSANNVIVDDQTAFVSHSGNRLQLVDISDPSIPELLSEIIPQNGSVGILEKFGNLIYGGGKTSIVNIINIDNPLEPTLVNQFSVNDYCIDMKIYNNYLHIAGYWGGLQIFDLSDPLNPVEIGYYPLDLALRVEASFDLAFIGDPYTSLRIFDTSNISNPILTGTYSIGNVRDICCSYDTLYAASSTGIHIYDVSNPYSSYEILSIPDCIPLDLKFKNNYLFSIENYEFKVYGDTTLVSVNNYQIPETEKSVLISNYPNPFNPSTTIEFSIQNDSHIELSIYNIKGQKIKTLAYNEFTKGFHSIIWNGDNEFGRSVSSGLYLYKLNVNGKIEAVKKCLLLK